MSFLFSSSQTQKNQQQSQQNQQYNTQGSNTTTPNEDPLFTAFRQLLLPAIGQEYAAAQKPVYGDAQIAANAEQANQTFNTGIDSATQALARRGALQSGAATSIAEGLGAKRAGDIAGFNAQLPFLNEQARSQKVNNLLGLASNFLGRSPLGQTSTSDTSGTSTGTSSGTSSGTTTNNPSLFSDIGGIAGVLAGI